MADDKRYNGADSRPTTGQRDSPSASLKSPRAARFAEATSVLSPIEPRTPRNQPPLTTTHYEPQPQPSDVGFGYISDNRSSKSGAQFQGVEVPITPISPLKSALKSPGAPPRTIVRPDTILSPTFYEDQELEKQEALTEKDQAKDLKVKTRVRLAKMILRGTNFSCSLIVLAMLASTFSIFNATKALPPRNGLPPWAEGTAVWPQITVLVIACVSLFMSMVIIYAYTRGGHRRAQKVAVYYTVFSVAFFVFSIVMWGIGAGILQQSKTSGNGSAIWGWSCKDNVRKQYFQQDVSYSLICRLQNWSLVCCIIEVVVEVITIAIYGIVFYRFYSKRRLRKSMARRDTARSDMYLAQLKSQSAPNTPGPQTPSGGGYNPLFSPRYANAANPLSDAEEGMAGTQYAAVTPPAASISSSQSAKPFVLQPVPGRTPKAGQGAFEPQPSTDRPHTPRTPSYAVPQSPIVHMPAAPGEQTYAPVPIPGAYAAPMSPVSPIASPVYTTPMEFGPPSQQSGRSGQTPRAAQPAQGQSQSQYASYFGIAR